MIENIQILYPEIFLSLSILIILMIGVFIKNSYNLVTNLTFLTLLVLIAILLNEKGNTLIFSEAFISDSFSIFIKILILISSLFILYSSQVFIKDNNINKFEYPIIFLIAILGMFFMVSSNDLILFYLGLELQSLALYILTAIDRDNLKSTESGIKFFILSALSSGLLLYGCSLLYGFTGSTNFEIINKELTSENVGAVFAMVFILVGLAFKVSAVPFHMWTPDVFEGSPSSITSFFAIVPKIAGIAVFIRFMQIPFENILIEWQSIIIFLSIASMILGAVAAIGQKNIKRLIAYSSIGHIGYALAGIATGTSSGYSSSVLYITIYAVMNLGIFGCIFLMKKDGKYTEEIKKLTVLNLPYYLNYNPQSNFYFASENSDFKVNPYRSEGSYTKYSSLDDKLDNLHFYTWFIKTGRGRCTEDAALEIRNNIINRDEAISLVKQYDGEFPKTYFKDILEYLEIDEKKFHEIIDKFRPEHLWKKENKKWVLKKAVWKNLDE